MAYFYTEDDKILILLLAIFTIPYVKFWGIYPDFLGLTL